MVHNNCMGPKFPQAPSPPTEYVCVEVYTVKTGDTLYSISQKYGISVGLLMEANQILNPYNLRYGQKICIPGHRTDCPDPDHDPCRWDAPAPAPKPMPAPAPPPKPMPAPAPAPKPMPKPTPVCDGMLYTIKAGDTFYLLAKQHNILLDDILYANPGVNPYNLQIGQQVCIPTNLAMPEEHTPVCNGIIHTVKSGDTLYMLAKQYKVTLDDIMNANPQIDCYMLQIGMRLCIPKANNQGSTNPLRTPSIPVPVMPPIPATPVPRTPTMPSIPTPAMPSMPTMPIPGTPFTPILPDPGMPTIPSIPTPGMPMMPGQIPTQTPAQPAAEAPEEAPVCEGLMHTVRAGDTLYMLAKEYKITLDALMKANPNLDPYNLRMGMQLCIPVNNNSTNRNQIKNPIAPAPSADGENDSLNVKIYKTQRGDTLTRILDRYEITFAALQISNPDVNFSGSLENISIRIPAEDHFRTCSMSGAYIVKSGDTLDSISKKLLVITDSLLMANPTLTIEDFSIPGTKICLPT